MNRLLLPITLAFLSLAGCSLLTAPEVPEHVLMPLEVGNKWIGDRTMYESGNAVTTRDTLELVAIEMIRGEMWYRANNGDRFINRSNGLEVKSDMCDGMVSKYPTRPGESVPVTTVTGLISEQGAVGDLDIVNLTVSIDSTVQVPAGTYSAHYYRLEITNPSAKFIQPVSRFYVPDLGPVRVDVERQGVLVERWELVEAVVE